MSQQRIAFKVHGTVQGVNFRSWAQGKASDLGLTGFVKNTSDDKVTGEAQGSQEAIGAYVKELNNGPRPAHVVKVDQEEIEIKKGESELNVTS